MKTRKTLMATAVVVLGMGQQVANAQDVTKNNSLIRLLPSEQTKGHLLLAEPPDNPVDSWVVSFYVMKLDEGSWPVSHPDSIVWVPLADKSIRLLGLNYVKIDPLFYTSTEAAYGIKVNASTVSGEFLETDIQPIGEPPTHFHFCDEICNGDDYAYAIRVYANQNLSNYYFRLERGGNPSTATPFYEYLSPTQWMNIRNSPGDYYDYHQIDAFLMAEANSTEVIVITNATPGQYKDKNGFNILGNTVYGVQKYLGDWRPPLSNVFYAQSPVVVGTPPNCNIHDYRLDLNGFVNFQSFGKPDPLVCRGASFTPSSSDGKLNVKDCLTGFNMTDPQWYNSDGSFKTTAWLKAIISCHGKLYNREPSNEIWSDDMSELVVFRMDEPGVATHITQADLFTPSGEFKGINMVIEPGFYGFMIHDYESNHFVFYTAVEKKMEVSIPLSDLISATFYPNPLTENKFSFDVSATAKLKVNYTLHDMTTGELLHNRNFVIQKDKERTYQVNPGKPLVEGRYYVNTFTMEDGSKKTWTVIR